MRRRCVFVSFIGSLLLAGPLRADDGAASIAAGGLVLMKREPRIVMAKEVLRISAKSVLVDYDFRNDSDEDITLLVEKPPLGHDPKHPVTDVNLVSFCRNGPVSKVDATHFSAHATNFVPTKELRIGFLQGYLMDDQ
jgi:hypothetical protein